MRPFRVIFFEFFKKSGLARSLCGSLHLLSPRMATTAGCQFDRLRPALISVPDAFKVNAGGLVDQGFQKSAAFLTHCRR